jgi:hypothetical protein
MKIIANLILLIGTITLHSCGEKGQIKELKEYTCFITIKDEFVHYQHDICNLTFFNKIIGNFDKNTVKYEFRAKYVNDSISFLIIPYKLSSSQNLLSELDTFDAALFLRGMYAYNNKPQQDSMSFFRNNSASYYLFHEIDKNWYCLICENGYLTDIIISGGDKKYVLDYLYNFNRYR